MTPFLDRRQTGIRHQHKQKIRTCNAESNEIESWTSRSSQERCAYELMQPHHAEDADMFQKHWHNLNMK